MLIRVVVRTGERKEHVVEREQGNLEIALKEPAANNLANKRLAELLAVRFGVPARAVRILAGHRRPRKTVNIDMV